MKTEKNKKKLSLNKITITQLDNDQIMLAKGGVDDSADSNCDTCSECPGPTRHCTIPRLYCPTTISAMFL